MKQIIKYSFFAASLLVLGGCKKFIDVNQNPNNLTDAPAQQVFSGALGNTYAGQISDNQHVIPGTWAGHYAHSTSFTGGGAEKTYEYTAANFNAFSGLFDNLNDYQFVKDNADADKVGYLKDAADVMQCYVFQRLVDLYGDVPYTNALKGNANPTPSYDNQKAIYENLVVRLDSAMARIARTTWSDNPTFMRQDIYFGGDKDSWIRFANTLKLRILMRQVYIPGRGAYITTNINNTLSRGYITSNVIVDPVYANQAGKLNPFYANYGYDETGTPVTNRNYRRINAVLADWLRTSVSTMPLTVPPASRPAVTANADTFRLIRLIAPRPNDVANGVVSMASYTGIPLGIGSGYSTGGSSPFGNFVIVPGEGDRPGMLMLLAEALFLQAEATERYAISFGGTTQQLYEAGVISHFRTVAANGGTGASANAGDAYALRYLARPLNNVNFVASTNKIRAILLQKWVSLVHINGLEAWSEYRKASGTADVGVPFSPRTTDPTTNPEPARYLYPQVEVNTNSSNIPAGVTRFTKVFWDVN